jgi:ABC-type Fe3+ transport system permease subunit
LYYKVDMPSIKRALAAAELLLVFPAALFMTSLFVRDVQPPQFEPAQTARRIVEWFSGHIVLGMGVFLIGLPLLALVIGCAAVAHGWRADPGLRQAALDVLAAVRAHFAMLLIAGASLIAGGILAIVAIHVITD